MLKKTIIYQGLVAFLAIIFLLPASCSNQLALYQLAKRGDAQAQYKLGNKYEYGIDVPRDIQQARYWYELAAKQGNTWARNNLNSPQFVQITSENNSQPIIIPSQSNMPNDLTSKNITSLSSNSMVSKQGGYTSIDDNKNTNEFIYNIDTKVKKYTPQGREIVSEKNCIEGDCMNGNGTVIYPNNTKYIGGFKDGQSSGQGTFFFRNGKKCIGEFKNGWMMKGIRVDLDGSSSLINGKTGFDTTYEREEDTKLQHYSQEHSGEILINGLYEAAKNDAERIKENCKNKVTFNSAEADQCGKDLTNCDYKAYPKPTWNCR